MKRLTWLALGASLMLIPPASASAVKFRGAAISGRQVRPRTLALSADGTIEAFDMHWTRWGGSTAIGYGSIEWHGCTPSCGADVAHNAPGSVHLSQIEYCEGGEDDADEGAFYAKASVYVREHGHLVVPTLPASYPASQSCARSRSGVMKFRPSPSPRPAMP